MPISALVLSALLAQTPPAAAVPPPDALAQAYYLFLQGRSLEGSGDTPGAIAAYRQALTLAPRAAEIHAELAGVYARQGDASSSVTEAEAALAIDPDDREAHRILGFVQSALAGRAGSATDAQALMTKAVAHFEAALATGVRDPGAELSLGRLYVQTQAYAQAVSRLQLFLLDRPGYPEALFLLAQALDRSGHPADSVAALEELVDEQPDQLQPRAMLAEGYERLGRWKDAADAWGELARQSPLNTLYQMRQAAASVSGGDLDAGRAQLQRLTRQTPRDVSAWFLLAQTERRAGNADAVEEAARMIAEIDPSDARGTLALAAARTTRGDVKGAVALLDARVKSATDRDVSTGVYARLVGDLSTALEQSGDRTRAAGVLEAARQRDPDDDDLTFALAGVYERDKRVDQAERMFRDIISRDPRNAPVLNYLGYMLADRGQKLPEAVGFIKRALALDADNPSFLDSLGWAYMKSAQYAEARDPLERAATALPQVSVIQDHLAQCYFQMKQYRDAAAAWDQALAGDREGVDVADITKRRDKARELAGR